MILMPLLPINIYAQYCTVLLALMFFFVKYVMYSYTNLHMCTDSKLLDTIKIYVIIMAMLLYDRYTYIGCVLNCNFF